MAGDRTRKSSQSEAARALARWPDLGGSRRAQTNVELLNELGDRGYAAEDLERVARAYELARDLFAGQFCSSGKPFLCHLVGTAGVLASVAAPAHAVLAGLLHSVYLRGDFGNTIRGVTEAKRRATREVIGGEAELLVFRFDALPVGAAGAAALLARIDKLHPVDRDALLVRLCDLFDQHVDRGVLYRPDVGPEQRFLREEAPVVVEIAARLGHGELSEALHAAFARNAALDVPAVLRSRPDALVLAPRTFHKRWRVVIAERVQALRERRPKT
jgi:(p)ppGpp synthase/HD superfamily hydrolase